MRNLSFTFEYFADYNFIFAFFILKFYRRHRLIGRRFIYSMKLRITHSNAYSLPYEGIDFADATPL